MSVKAERTKQLGIDPGTASARLGRAILLSLVRKLGLDRCLRCGLPITEAADLSVDHRVPWLDASTGLFWDLGNVAFSHRACNAGSARNGWGTRFAGISRHRRDQQLGLKYSTAMHRLRKAVMLDLLQRAGKDACYRCHRPIADPEELSVDHKADWLHADASLFWDLENIAFAHRSCNRPKRNGAIRIRKVGPDGTAWCRDCKQFLPIHQFGKSKTHWSGLDIRCKSCRGKINLRYRSGFHAAAAQLVAQGSDTAKAARSSRARCTVRALV